MADKDSDLGAVRLVSLEIKVEAWNSAFDDLRLGLSDVLGSVTRIGKTQEASLSPDKVPDEDQVELSDHLLDFNGNRVGRVLTVWERDCA